MEAYEIESVVIAPYFEAVRDEFLSYEPEPGVHLTKLKRTRFIVDPSVADSPRHFAACRDDGLEILLAPDCTMLPVDGLLPLLRHEFGHAADFAYPGFFLTDRNKAAHWIGDSDEKPARMWRRMWHERSADQVEWGADSIALAVTGHRIQYCGPCLIQCFRGGKSRPAGLR